MPGLILPSRFTQQPQYGAPIDWGNPITKGLRVAVLPSLGWGARDLVGGKNISALYGGSTPAPVRSDTNGIALVQNRTSYNQLTTISAWTNVTGEGSAFIIRKGSGARLWEMGAVASLDDFPYSGNVYSDAFWTSRWINGVAPPSGKSCASYLKIGVSVKNGSQRAFWDGDLWTTATASGGFAVPTNISYGCDLSGSSTGTSGESLIFLGLAWERFLSDAEQRSLAANPWQIFYKDKVIFLTAAGGAAALAGNAAAIASATGALSTAISISGAAVGVTTATGALSTSMTLSGAAAAVAVASGNLTLGLSLAGSAIANAVASGALGTQFGLAGAVQMAASATGTMQVQVTLSGSAIANAVATGNLVATGSSALAGDAQVQASASGILSTNLPLAGNAQVVAAASGNLTNGVPLAGAAVAVVTALGNITATVTLSGAAVANAIAAGGMALSIPLAGAAIMQAIASGYLSVSGGAGPVGSVARAFSVLLEEREFLIPPEQRLLILAAEFRQSSPAP